MIQTAGIGQILQHLRAKPARGALLDRDHRRVVAHQLGDEIGIQGLGKTGIRNGHRNALLRQKIGRRMTFVQMRAKGQ